MFPVRALLRAYSYNPIPLSTSSHPQLVDDQGIEVEHKDEQDKEDLDEDVGDEALSDEMIVVEDVAAEGSEPLEIQVVATKEENLKEDKPLLNAAESLVLPYSLIQTRHHHLTSLFPLVFSHPPIPSHNRPRAKPLPKGVFMFPTPPLPANPLPTREYHGPKDTPLVGNLSPLSAQSPGPAPLPKPPVKRKTIGEVEPPAHEIECIARVTVTIGPISFPNTELWVGHFVEPRAAKPRKERAKPGERKERERKRREELDRLRISGQVGPSTPQLPNINRLPVKNPNTAPVRPFGPSNIRPPVPRTAASPQLIQLVNQAASRHSWLSSLIYKAAGSTASAEELEKLGKAVARLSKGEPINDLASAASVGSAASKPPETAKNAHTKAADKPASSTCNVSTPLSSMSNYDSPKNTDKNAADKQNDDDDDDDSDGEVDMKGPKQVGGGPMPFSDTPIASGSTSVPLSAPANSAIPIVRPSLSAVTNFTSNTSSPDVSSIPRPPPLTTNVKTSPSVNHFTPSPKPTLPCPPPFLLLAFKERQVDKFLIPLGSRSFISRIGGDYVTTKSPIDISSTLDTKGSAVPMHQKDSRPVSKTSISRELEALRTDTPEGAFVTNESQEQTPKQGRTRASFSRASTKPVDAPFVEQPAEPEKSVLAPQPILRTGLSSFPEQTPRDGTVLLSTLVPADQWTKVNWDTLGKKLPWNEDWERSDQNRVKDEDKESTLTSEVTYPKPFTSKPLLNLATEDFLSPDGPLNAVTVRLGEIDDNLWRRIKTIMSTVERTEIKSLADAGKLLLPKILAASEDELVSKAHPADNPVVKAAYLKYKQNLFSLLTPRARRPRRFLRTRLSSPPSDLIDATFDRMGPKPYPVSTKPLYHVEEVDVDDSLAPVRLSPELNLGDGLGRRKKKGKEETVTFEMPLSLTALDERVEAGAKKVLGKRGRKSGGGSDDRKKEKQKRPYARGICEGCAKEGIKVWRRGPNGKGTLCNTCGDLFTEGKLKEKDLKAPGAMKAIYAQNASISVEEDQSNQNRENHDVLEKGVKVTKKEDGDCGETEAKETAVTECNIEETLGPMKSHSTIDNATANKSPAIVSESIQTSLSSATANSTVSVPDRVKIDAQDEL
ncbi:hypothetical protein L204_100598 [Cryptococcus depauperatus]|nr:hypothetical protein L204_01471 [Cryptococcus depauperatus CBS 7855]